MNEQNIIGFKIIVVGNNNIGKNSFIENSFRHLQIKDGITSSNSKHNLQTIKQNGEFKIKLYEFEKQKIKLQLWRYDSNPGSTTNSKIFRGAHCIIVMFDLNNKVSFNNLKGWIQECKRYCSSPIIIIGSKFDLIHQLNRNNEQFNESDIKSNIKEIMKSLSNSSSPEKDLNPPYYEISNNSNFYNNEIQEKLFRTLINHSKEYQKILSPSQFINSNNNLQSLNINNISKSEIVVSKKVNKNKRSSLLSIILFWRK